MKEWQYQTSRDFGLRPADRLRSLERESGLVATGLHSLSWCATRTFFSLYHRLSIEGRENLPRRPRFVLVANHCSHLDALAISAAVPWRYRERVFPIAAGDTFFETPALALFSALTLNALPMWRRNCGRHALEDLRRRLVEGRCIFILFPEGTRSTDGHLGEFKPGLGKLVGGTGVPVVPCHLTGTFEAWPKGTRLPRPRRVRLRIGRPVDCSGVGVDKASARALCARLRREIELLSGAAEPAPKEEPT